MAPFLQLIALLFLSILITTIHGNADDAQIIITENALNRVAPNLIPLLSEEIMNASTDPQTVNYAGLSAEIGAVTIANLSIENITLSLNATTQQIVIDTHNIAMTLNDISFYSGIRVRFIGTVKCEGYLEASLDNWNISLTVSPIASKENCSLILDLVDSKVYDGGFDFDIVFPNEPNTLVKCSDITKMADFYLNIEELIVATFIDQIPSLLQDEVEKALDGGVKAGDIEVCVANVTIYDESLFVSGDFLFPENEVLTAMDYNSANPAFVDESLLTDDSSLISFFVCMCLLSGMLGCAAGSLAFWGCYKESFGEYYAQKKGLTENLHHKRVQMERVKSDARLTTDGA